ncbi:unnamed protein product [Anisakis simplex]|uniref:Uncharacterized protein n=1 Tax=Anisakis simplex TaxID=6269 RepID=A0A0M3JI02_ANISI|nr:unnamed protein product [Anisakis simplex]
MDSGIADREQEDNERNAHLLSAHFDENSSSSCDAAIRWPYRSELHEQSPRGSLSRTRFSSCIDTKANNIYLTTEYAPTSKDVPSESNI